MKKVTFLGFVSALSMIASVVSAHSALADGCGPTAAASASCSEWGGKGIGIEVQNKVAHFEFNCAGGIASDWKKLVNLPNFKILVANGPITHMSGIEQIGHQPVPVPAKYQAVVVDGDAMILSVESEGKIQKFELKKNARAEVEFCE